MSKLDVVVSMAFTSNPPELIAATIGFHPLLCSSDDLSSKEHCFYGIAGAWLNAHKSERRSGRMGCFLNHHKRQLSPEAVELVELAHTILLIMES